MGKDLEHVSLKLPSTAHTILYDCMVVAVSEICERFALVTSTGFIKRWYLANDAPEGIEPRYNIAPGQKIVVIIEQPKSGMSLIAVEARWGYSPPRKKSKSLMAIKAWLESATELNAVREQFRRYRCSIPASGFYLWNGRTPFFFRRKDKTLMGLGGLFYLNNGNLDSVVMVTCPPNRMIMQVSNRMPLVIQRDDEWRWMHNDTTGYMDRMRWGPIAGDEMEGFPVKLLPGEFQGQIVPAGPCLTPG